MFIDLNNLLSGLFGALLGGLITYFSTIKSIKETAKLDAERREKDKKILRSRLIQNINVEIRYNLSLTKKIQISYAKVRFLVDAYEGMRFHADLVHDSEILNKLQEIYIEIRKFNSLAEYEQAKMSPGTGTLDNDLEEQAKMIKNKIDTIVEIEDMGN